VDTLATGLDTPWDLAFLGGGEILLTERSGRIRLIDAAGLRAQPWAVLDVSESSEAGLMGIDVAPDFEVSGHVFVLGSYLDAPSGTVKRRISSLLRRLSRAPGSGQSTARKGRVTRLSARGERGDSPVVVMEGLPSFQLHAGGALRFGPDGLLYLSLGDGTDPQSAARWESLKGTILRLDRTGRVPFDNPRRRSPIFATGLRNVQGLAWDPVSGDLFAIDHGPSGLEQEEFRRDADELNRVAPGGDHGWPAVAGAWLGGGIVPPMVEWTPALAPAGLTFVSSPGSPWDGNAFVTGLRGSIERLVLEPVGGTETPDARVICRETLFSGEYGRLRGLRAGPDGALYFTTSPRRRREPAPGSLTESPAR
jgi:glucose/arabinose dehydrogenase